MGAAGFEPGRPASARHPCPGLDLSFSDNGRQTTDFGDRDQANGVALQPGGKIVAVGIGGGTDGFPGDFAVARYQGG